ncbi:MAG: Arc family DNA-binding protein [Pararhizobium sp.]
MADSADEVRLTLRLPARVRDHLLQKGKESGRSLNAEIVNRLERSVDFEDEYGSLEQVMTEVWKDIDELKTQVNEHDRHIFPQRHDWD